MYIWSRSSDDISNDGASQGTISCGATTADMAVDLLTLVPPMTLIQCCSCRATATGGVAYGGTFIGGAG